MVRFLAGRFTTISYRTAEEIVSGENRSHLNEINRTRTTNSTHSQFPIHYSCSPLGGLAASCMIEITVTFDGKHLVKRWATPLQSNSNTHTQTQFTCRRHCNVCNAFKYSIISFRIRESNDVTNGRWIWLIIRNRQCVWIHNWKLVLNQLNGRMTISERRGDTRHASEQSLCARRIVEKPEIRI